MEASGSGMNKNELISKSGTVANPGSASTITIEDPDPDMTKKELTNNSGMCAPSGTDSTINMEDSGPGVTKKELIEVVMEADVVLELAPQRATEARTWEKQKDAHDIQESDAGGSATVQEDIEFVHEEIETLKGEIAAMKKKLKQIDIANFAPYDFVNTCISDLFKAIGAEINKNGASINAQLESAYANYGELVRGVKENTGLKIRDLECELRKVAQGLPSELRALNERVVLLEEGCVTQVLDALAPLDPAVSASQRVSAVPCKYF